MSLEAKPIYPAGTVCTPSGDVLFGDSGMTLLEYYAGLAMQGICANSGGPLNPPQDAHLAVEYARALIAELEKQP